MMNEIVGWVCGLLMILAVVGGSLYGCQQSNNKYYDALNKCTDRGGTWVPNTNGVNTGLCISPRPAN